MEYEIGPDESVSMAIIRAVSAVAGREPCSLQPLENVLDTDALDALFAARLNGTARNGGSLTFVYSGYRVRIENGEYLATEPVETRRRESVGVEADALGS